jgi:hypothetical protein
VSDPAARRELGDRLEIKTGGGCLMLFGLPFFAAGLFVMSLPFWEHGGDDAPAFFVIPFGLIFASVGGGIMFGRAGTVADNRTRTLTRWWGLLVPFKSTSVSFDDIEAVTILREVRRSKNSTYTVYPVRITGKGGTIDIETPRDYDSARKRSEDFAKFIDVRVEDSSSGERVVREAGTLDESLRDRLRREGRPAVRPVEPDGCRIATSAAGSEAVFEIPPRGFGIGEYIVVGFIGVFEVVSLFIGLAAVGGILSDGEDAPLPMVVGMGVFGLVWLGLPLLAILGIANSAKAVDRVIVSPRELRVERKGIFGLKTLVIPADELEELHLGRAENRVPTSFAGSQTIVARSDRVSISLGAGLTPDELTWLHDVIKFIVTA